MRVISSSETAQVSGGAMGLGDWVLVAQFVDGAVHEFLVFEQNLGQAGGQDPTLEALRLGNMGP